jgi:hypothetical protein
MPARVVRKVRSFLQQPIFIKLWFLPLWFLLGVCKAFIFTVSFKRLAPIFGVTLGISVLVPLLPPDQEQLALKIGRAVRLAANYTPWDSNCFPQAIAARILLGLYRVPYVLYFGLMREPQTSEIKAHAWVAAGRVNVTGGASFDVYSVVGVFASPLLMKDQGP